MYVCIACLIFALAITGFGKQTIEQQDKQQRDSWIMFLKRIGNVSPFLTSIDVEK